MKVSIRYIVYQHEHLEEGLVDYAVEDWAEVAEICTLLEANKVVKTEVKSIEVV